jgi:predicted unusual protein kinase regulating ubiquinone biosynthesis (AarF/ABC1/UbiB family)
VRRYGEIVRILVKHGFVDVVDALHLRAYLTAGRRVLSALGHDSHPEPSRAVRLRLAFEELGPTFIKFGQALSTHSDLLPAEVIAELTRLQDTVPPSSPVSQRRRSRTLSAAASPMCTIEAVGRQLDPTFKIVEHATPFVESLIEQKYTPEALALRTAKAGRDVLSGLRTLPANLAEITRKIRADGMQVQFVHRNLDFFVREMDRSSNRLSFAVVIAAIVIGSSIIVHASVGPQAFGYPLLGLAGFVTAGVLGIGLALGILRSGRL